MNNTQLIGRLTKDVDMRYTPNGVAVSVFTLAVNRPFKNKDGEFEADFIRIQSWRKLAENVANYCKKGSQVAVTGRIQTSSFEGKNGEMVYLTEVVADRVEFLDTRNKQNNQQQQNQQGTNQTQYQSQPSSSDDPFGNAGEPIDINDKDLPF